MVEIIEEDTSEAKTKLEDIIIEDEKGREEEIVIEEDDEDEEDEEYKKNKDGAEDEEGDKEDAFLERAISMGYSPNYKGVGAKTPQEFVEIADNNAAIQKERNEKLLLDKKRDQKALDFYERQNKVLLIQLEEKIEGQEERVQEARDLGDIDDFEKQKLKLDELESQKKDFSETDVIDNKKLNQEDFNRRTEEFVINSSWYGKEGMEEVTAAAERYVEDNHANRIYDTGKSIESLFSEIDRFARTTFPDKFYRAPPTKKKGMPPFGNTASKPAGNNEGEATRIKLNSADRAVVKYMEERWKRQGLSPEDVKKKRRDFLKTAAAKN